MRTGQPVASTTQGAGQPLSPRRYHKVVNMARSWLLGKDALLEAFVRPSAHNAGAANLEETSMARGRRCAQTRGARACLRMPKGGE